MDNQIIITISREYGSGGRDIGKLIAEKLNIAYYDHEIIQIAAKNSGLSDKFLSENDEVASTSIFGGFMTGASFFSNQAFSHGELNINDKLFIMESEIIRNLADRGSCVIIGRCANYVLREYQHTLNVFIHANLAFRKKRAVELYGIPEKKIEDFLHKQDKHRAHYRSFYTDQKWNCAENYNLTIDSSKFGIEGAVDLIITAANIKNSI